MWRMIVIGLLVALCAPTTPALSANLVVVVSQRSVIETISADTLTRIFLGTDTFVDGVRVHPIALLQGSDTRAAFLRSVLHTSERRYKAHWIKRIFRAGDPPPREVATVAEMIQRVREDVTAVGYIYTPIEMDTSGLREVFRKPM